MSASHLMMQMKRPPGRYIWAVLSLVLISTFTVIVFNSRTVSSNFRELLPSPRPGGVEDTLFDKTSNATLGFEKIFVISLPKRTDHRDRLLLASRVSDIDIDILDGVRGDEIALKSLPANYNEDLGPANIGAWRAHLNALRKIIELDLSSAIIMEDDVDWDVRLKPTLKDYALSSNALLKNNLEDLSFDKVTSMDPPRHSPYGDGWDVMWLGHCGMHLPNSGMILHENDPTVPEHHYLHSFMMEEVTPLASYPQHTRAVFHNVVEGTCSLAYAVTQSAARRMLLELGLEKLTESFDLMLRGWCEKSDHVCLSVLPQLFDHYRRAGPGDVDSDISVPNEKPRIDPYTNNIRWSVQMNMGKLLNNETDYDDQYPDS